MINIGIIGCGYWGPNYIRVFNELKENRVVCCCDLQENNLAKIGTFYHDMKIIKDYKKITQDPAIDAVVIVVPLDAHYEIARFCLKSGKHVLIEKPFVQTIEEAEGLIHLAEKNNLVLMVGHVYEYNPGVQKLKEIIKENKLGNIYYVQAERVGLGPIRKHASVLWDLATHDISIGLYLFDNFPEEVIALGGSYIQKDVEDMVFVSLKFPSKIIYNINTSWIAPEKVRKITVVGSNAMAVLNDVNKSEPLKIYERKIDKGLISSTPEYRDHLAIVHIGDIYSPMIEQTEPLKIQAQHFLECILEKKKPLTDGYSGLNVIRVLKAAERSLKEQRGIKCR